MSQPDLNAAALLALALRRADDALVLGHRLSEWTGHAPMLEEEMALANLALDLIGQSRALYSLAAELEGEGRDEDALAYLRTEREYSNLLLLELPKGDFAVTIVRQFLYASFVDRWWRATMASSDARLAAIAAKAEKETAYHVRHAAEWLIRLGDGTAESHSRAQHALDRRHRGGPRRRPSDPGRLRRFSRQSAAPAGQHRPFRRDRPTGGARSTFQHHLRAAAGAHRL